ncbi:50S ribosomal protein L31 type B [Frankliniella fusca]|uniref:50S ribosomal protein L31 type B n=1 Tax=Frankliniella fusca TaxID=407009 RepID=A0AAE1H4Q7_9NEOP|nr:50S ribosomal protein L31 type B [Frankliniella fusca]
MTGATLLCLMLADVCYRATMAAFAGPYWLSIRQFVDCPKDEMDVARNDLHSSAVFRYNRTIKSPVMDVNMTLANRVFFRGESKCIKVKSVGTARLLM